MNAQTHSSKLEPRPLLISSAVAALVAATVLTIGIWDSTVLGAVAMPVALCWLPVLWNTRPAAVLVLTTSILFLLAFVVIATMSVGLFFLPSAVLLLLALRRSIRFRRSAEKSDVPKRTPT
jgi:hypothetical protein